jgi:hypothetical protein
VTTLARTLYQFAISHWGTISIGAAAFYGWSNNLFSAFIASLPDPDNPADWQEPNLKYRVFYRTMGHWNNKPMPPKL